MEKAVSQSIDPPRHARPWFVATAVLCGIATVLFGFYQWQHRAWEAEVVRHNCRTPLPPRPASGVLGWPLAALISAALITVLVGLVAVLIGRHRWWTKATAAALLAAHLLFCLLIVLVVVLVAADPEHGSVQTPESYLCPWLNGYNHQGSGDSCRAQTTLTSLTQRVEGRGLPEADVVSGDQPAPRVGR